MQLCLGPWVVQKLGMQQWTRHGDPYLLELHLSGKTDRGQVSGLSLPGLRDPRARLLIEQSPSWEEDVGGVWMHLQEEVTLKLRPWAWVREGQKWKSALGRRNSLLSPCCCFYFSLFSSSSPLRKFKDAQVGKWYVQHYPTFIYF